MTYLIESLISLSTPSHLSLNTVAAVFYDGKCITENQIMNNGWIGKADGGGSRGRGRGRGDLTGVKPFKPAAKELEGVSDEKRSRGRWLC